MRELKYRPDHVDSDIRVPLSAVLCNDTENVALKHDPGGVRLLIRLKALLHCLLTRPCVTLSGTANNKRHDPRVPATIWSLPERKTWKLDHRYAQGCLRLGCKPT